MVSQVRRQDSSRHGPGHSGRQGVLQPLLSDAAQQDIGSSNLVLHEINLTVRSGDLLVVTGEIGAGECSVCTYSLLWHRGMPAFHPQEQCIYTFAPTPPVFPLLQIFPANGVTQ